MESLQLSPLSSQIGVGIVPIQLGLHAPFVTLRPEGFCHGQTQRLLAFMDIATKSAFPDFALRQLVLDPLPNPIRGVALLPRRFLVTLRFDR
jgi:hypothetical protein